MGTLKFCEQDGSSWTQVLGPELGRGNEESQAATSKHWHLGPLLARGPWAPPGLGPASASRSLEPVRLSPHRHNLGRATSRVEALGVMWGKAQTPFCRNCFQSTGPSQLSQKAAGENSDGLNKEGRGGRRG